MGVEVEVCYEGELRCRATHGPSGDELLTDAPTDNQGKGQSFSPTDLVATAMATCMLTIMGIAARTHGIAMEGASAHIEKHMIADPYRRIDALPVTIRVPGKLDQRQKSILRKAALSCPVHRSLDQRVKKTVDFVWAD